MEGEELFVDHRWRTAFQIDRYVPPSEEDMHAFAAQAQDAARRGDFEAAEEAGRALANVARELADQRGVELHISTGGMTLRVEPDHPVPVRRKDSDRQATVERHAAYNHSRHRHTMFYSRASAPNGSAPYGDVTRTTEENS